MSRRIWLIALTALWVSAPAQAQLVLGVHPFKPATRLVDAFAPLTQYLSNKLGQPVTLRISQDYQTHIDATGQNAFDIAYLGPSLYVKLRDAHGERPLLARQRIGAHPVFHSKIFVRANSPINDLAGLAGKRFVFGDPKSTMGHLVPRYQLWQAGITVDRLAGYRYVGDHVNIALGVLAGEFDAGAVKEDVFYQYEKRGLRAIATSAPMSDHLFVASTKMPPALVDRLRAIMLTMHQDPRGLEALQAVTAGINALVPVQDSDYDSLRAVLNKLHELGVRD
ncbi:MAG: phosphate/phosphite/phosphonate ABC transporter substrate-binding protein [Thiobacillus sp.]|nr:phosphate/phosphite/phosphonate ABC transporter substrate-binding protein [Thiobacillus sp.]